MAPNEHAIPLPPDIRSDKRTRRRQRIFYGISVANFWLVFLAVILGDLLGERTWLTTLVAYCPPLFIAVPTLLLFPVALLRRERRAILLNGTAFLFAITILMGFHLPLTRKPVSDAPRLRVLTYNIQHGIKGADAIAKVVRAANTDVVCFQEVNGYGVPDPYPALVAALPEYQIVRIAETAVASRLPILQTRAHPLIATSVFRVATEAIIEVRGRPVSVISVHLATAANAQSLTNRKSSIPDYLRKSGAIRLEQVARLREATETISHPLLVCGDFNTPPRGILYRRLSSEWEDAFAARGVGYGWTYPTQKPVLRIDYIFCGNGVRAASAAVPNAGSSDHRPVVAEVTLP